MRSLKKSFLKELIYYSIILVPKNKHLNNTILYLVKIFVLHISRDLEEYYLYFILGVVNCDLLYFLKKSISKKTVMAQSHWWIIFLSIF